MGGGGVVTKLLSCSVLWGGGLSLQIFDVIREIKRVSVLLAGQKAPLPSLSSTNLARSLFSD